ALRFARTANAKGGDGSDDDLAAGPRRRLRRQRHRRDGRAGRSQRVHELLQPRLADGDRLPRSHARPGEGCLKARATMHVSELWRYPVKSLKGERLNEVELTEQGLLGDRLVHVRSRSGRVITSRTKPRLLA